MRLYGIYIEYKSVVSGSSSLVRSMYKPEGKNCWNQNKAIVEQQARMLYKSDGHKYMHIEIISVEVATK